VAGEIIGARDVARPGVVALYTVTLTVTDSNGLSGSDSHPVLIQRAAQSLATLLSMLSGIGGEVDAQIRAATAGFVGAPTRARVMGSLGQDPSSGCGHAGMG
jgi:hypothetical protein